MNGRLYAPLAALLVATACELYEPLALERAALEPVRCAVVEPAGEPPADGHLDVAATTDFLVGLNVRWSPLDRAPPDDPEGRPLDATIKAIWYSYRTDSELSLPTFTEWRQLVIEPGSTTPLVLNLFRGGAAEALRSQLSAGTERRVHVDVRAHVGFRRGGSTVLGPLTYVVSVTHSGAHCGDAEDFVRTGPCGRPGGQDGAPIACCPRGDPACSPVR